MYDFVAELNGNRYIYGDVYASDFRAMALKPPELQKNMSIVLLGRKRPNGKHARNYASNIRQEMAECIISMQQTSEYLLVSAGIMDFFDGYKPNIDAFRYMYVKPGQTTVRIDANGRRVIGGVAFYSDFVDEKTGEWDENTVPDLENRLIFVLSRRPNRLKDQLCIQEENQPETKLAPVFSDSSDTESENDDRLFDFAIGLDNRYLVFGEVYASDFALFGLNPPCIRVNMPIAYLGDERPANESLWLAGRIEREMAECKPYSLNISYDALQTAGVTDAYENFTQGINAFSYMYVQPGQTKIFFDKGKREFIGGVVFYTDIVDQETGKLKRDVYADTRDGFTIILSRRPCRLEADFYRAEEAAEKKYEEEYGAAEDDNALPDDNGLFNIVETTDEQWSIFGETYESDFVMCGIDSPALPKGMSLTMLGKKRPKSTAVLAEIHCMRIGMELTECKMKTNEIPKEFLRQLGIADDYGRCKPQVTLLEYMYVRPGQTSIYCDVYGKMFVGGVAYYSDFIDERTGAIRENMAADVGDKFILICGRRPNRLQPEFDYLYTKSCNNPCVRMTTDIGREKDDDSLFDFAVCTDKRECIFGQAYESDFKMFKLRPPEMPKNAKTVMLGKSRSNSEWTRAHLYRGFVLKEAAACTLREWQIPNRIMEDMGFKVNGAYSNDINIFMYMYVRPGQTKIRCEESGERIISGAVFYSDLIDGQTGNLKEITIDANKNFAFILAVRPKRLQAEFDEEDRRTLLESNTKKSLLKRKQTPEIIHPGLLMKDYWHVPAANAGGVTQTPQRTEEKASAPKGAEKLSVQRLDEEFTNAEKQIEYKNALMASKEKKHSANLLWK